MAPVQPMLSLDARDLPADLAALEALLRLCLAARRDGCRLRLRDASPELADLAAFVGVDEVLLERG